MIVSAGNIACIVLASGLSERFGEPDKLSVDLCGKPVLSHVLDTAREVGFGEIFCVSQICCVDGVTCVKNDFPEYGQGHALKLGLVAARKSGWEVCTIMLGDMPLVTPSYLERLISKSHTNQCVVSLTGSIRQPPAIFNLTAIDLILSQEPVRGARDIFDRLNPVTLELEPDAARDVDTPADLASVARIMEARKT